MELASIALFVRSDNVQYLFMCFLFMTERPSLSTACSCHGTWHGLHNHRLTHSAIDFVVMHSAWMAALCLYSAYFTARSLSAKLPQLRYDRALLPCSMFRSTRGRARFSTSRYVQSAAAGDSEQGARHCLHGELHGVPHDSVAHLQCLLLVRESERFQNEEDSDDSDTSKARIVRPPH